MLILSLSIRELDRLVIYRAVESVFVSQALNTELMYFLSLDLNFEKFFNLKRNLLLILRKF